MGRQTFDTKRRVNRSPKKRPGPPQNLPGQTAIRRRPQKPSLWRHAFGAFSILLAVGAALALYIQLYGDPADAVPQQLVALDPPAMPAPSDTLNGAGTALPDLLGNDVPSGINPTAVIAKAQDERDALGNPIYTAGPDGELEHLAGQPQRPAPSAAADASNPITINGQPIGEGLVRAPVSGLSRNSPYGKVPAKAPDGRTAFKVYARPYNARANTKPVSLMIGGLGINRSLTQRAINELPPAVTLAFAAHAPNLQNQINQARTIGHEVLIELPMESAEFNPAEPGATHTLRSGGTSAAENKRNLDWLLSRASGYFAVTNYNGGAFLQRSDSVVPVLANLSDAGVGFVFDNSVDAPSLPTLASASKLPFLKAFSLIDSAPDTASITAELARITALAQSGGAPVSVGFTYPQTIDAVVEWVNSLDAAGLTLAPVSSRVPPTR